MASQTLDPSLLNKRSSGDPSPASPGHASLLKSMFNPASHHDKPLDHASMCENESVDLDLDSVAPDQVVDISETVEYRCANSSQAFLLCY